MPPKYSPRPAQRTGQKERKQDVRAAQIDLLYKNVNTGIAVTLLVAPVLAYLQSFAVRRGIVLSWLAYTLLVALARFALARTYYRALPEAPGMARWGIAFAVGAGLAGAGWGAAGILLYPDTGLANQLFLVFVLGGMMLGGVTLLAARPEAFCAFLLPTGIVPALRLASESDKEHLAMGILAALFTVATLTTTWRLYRTIQSSLELQFYNNDLVDELRAANTSIKALNEDLEQRVLQRTSELRESNVRLKAEIEQRLQMEQELLRVRNLESLGVLAGGIAHDFNNFLTVVQGNIELAKTQLHPGSPVQSVLEESAAACGRAAVLSSQLLTFAKGGAPVRQVTSVGRLILDSVNLERAGSPVSILADVPEDLWSAEVDSSQISQVLHNLLLNGKQAMPEGGTLEVHAENIPASPGHSAEAIRISIRDNGPGIPAEVLPRIFDPYFTTKQGGSGLGLATTYAIVARHGGRISVRSNAGEGTEFLIDLPASRQRPEPEVKFAPPPRKGAGKLLVMDDEEALRKLLCRNLTKLGYEVETARDGGQAIALYQAARAEGRGFDAVLLDLTINGGMGGVEAAARLKEIDPAAKLIVSSGYSDSAVMSTFREYGFEEVIPKPWHAAQLSEVIRRVLAGGVEPPAL